MMILGVSTQALAAQLLIGISNGLVYAALSMGLAIIFGLLHVINFAHGAFFMLGGLATWAGLEYLGINFWAMLILTPLLVAIFGFACEQLLIKHTYRKNYLYGLMLTLGLTLVIESTVRAIYGVSGHSYTPMPVQGVTNLGFIVMPTYRLVAIIMLLGVIVGTIAVIEKTRVGAYLRAAKENRDMVEALGIKIKWYISGAFIIGIGVAAVVGAIMTPILQIGALSGESYLIIAFAVVVIGGMGSLRGAVIAGITLGVIEGLTKTWYPPASDVSIFVVMTIILIVWPHGLFGE